MQRNILKNFGPIINNGLRVASFFGSSKTNAGGNEYKNVGKIIGNSIYSILY